MAKFVSGQYGPVHRFQYKAIVDRVIRDASYRPTDQLANVAVSELRSAIMIERLNKAALRQTNAQVARPESFQVEHFSHTGSSLGLSFQLCKTIVATLKLSLHLVRHKFDGPWQTDRCQRRGFRLVTMA